MQVCEGRESPRNCEKTVTAGEAARVSRESTSREDVDQTMGRVGTWAKKEQLGLEKRKAVCRRVEALTEKAAQGTCKARSFQG